LYAVSDLGLTHVALPASDLPASLAFYRRYARMEVVHHRLDPVTGSEVAWISDGTRPFVVVLISAAKVEHPLLPIAHLGVGCRSREEVDRLCEAACAEGVLRLGPIDAGYPVGYWALLADPDGHTLEISHGQEVGLAVERHRAANASDTER
jgi:catechol 2,3-dioxygenase-like lactoylglutathione lyase family enzyme